MTDIRPFRFGVTGAPRDNASEWRSLAVRAAELGYATLLMPDVPHLLSPFPALATAAASADIAVGTYVLAAPLRPAGSAAWDAHSLSVLTEGRFEMGIGTGRPDVEQWTTRVGLPYGSPAERLAQVAATIDRLRELDGALHTPVLMAVGGPRARALAAEKADIVTIAAGALTARDDVAAQLADLRARGGQRTAQLEVLMNLFVVGEDVPPHAQRYIGADAATLIANDSLVILRGSVPQMVEELQRRRERFGASYVTVNAEYIDQFAPVVATLTGQ
ncbi:MAG TPA: LLM class flavin-dependent oxidoreductase [Jatrophihabitans sp.]|nr:LLM class flavin-dependent oxidoreductase [Jatrophihabitans sp.]